jgi:hypothetical protein
MKLKLNTEDASILEVFVLDIVMASKMKRIKDKFLNSKPVDKFITVHLSNDEYLFLLDSIESKMSDTIFSVYEKLIMQDSKNLIKPVYMTPHII